MQSKNLKLCSREPTTRVEPVACVQAQYSLLSANLPRSTEWQTQATWLPEIAWKLLLLDPRVLNKIILVLTLLDNFWTHLYCKNRSNFCQFGIPSFQKPCHFSAKIQLNLYI